MCHNWFYNQGKDGGKEIYILICYLIMIKFLLMDKMGIYKNIKGNH